MPVTAGTVPTGPDVFFVSDSGEEEARAHPLRGFRRVWFVGLLWLAASAFLYWTAS